MKDLTTTVIERCELLSTISEEPGIVVRPYGSQAMDEVNNIVAGWMQMAGMNTRRDAIGNLIGRYEGEGENTLILGSHLDTGRDASKYDGILGVMVALACVQQLHNRGESLPFSIEVVAFADEEGLRFGTTFLGSSVYAGAFDEKLLDLEDQNGVTLSQAVHTFGGNPDALERAGRGSEDLLGYCEVRIEQGPVLEQKDLPVGVVSAINGQSRMRIGFAGKAGHAGTVPMEHRRDALCAAAELVLEAEQIARAETEAVATVGEISVLPGAVNVIPAETIHSLDLRHPDDAVRERLRDHLKKRTREIAVSRGCGHEWQLRQETSAGSADPEFSSLLENAVEHMGITAYQLPSGAGHDAAQMATLTSITMFFVRCKESLSHHPDESVTEEDVGIAIEVMKRFLELVGEAHKT
jgi:allantoate deiminase